MEKVSAHVYIDPAHSGCTVGAIQSSEGVVLVDSPHRPTRARKWLAEVEALGEVRYLINTEFHIDHTFGNAFLPGRVIAHEQTRENFWEDGVLGPNPMKNPSGFVEKQDPQGIGLIGGYKAREPEVVFDGRLSLSLGDVTLEAFGMPGHVPADTAVHVLEDGVLFTSDNVFHGSMTWYQDALPFEWLETLERFKGMDVQVVIPGHGDAAGPAVFDEMRQEVEDAIGEVQSAIHSGMSRDEAMERITFIQRQPPAEDHEALAPMLQRVFVGRIYDQIQARTA